MIKGWVAHILQAFPRGSAEAIHFQLVTLQRVDLAPWVGEPTSPVLRIKPRRLSSAQVVPTLREDVLQLVRNEARGLKVGRSAGATVVGIDINVKLSQLDARNELEVFVGHTSVGKLLDLLLQSELAHFVEAVSINYRAWCIVVWGGVCVVHFDRGSTRARLVAFGMSTEGC